MSETANQPQVPEVKPPEGGGMYLALSILATLFCCLPFGIPAIVFASQIDGKLNSGDIAGAIRSAKQAKIWIIVSAASGLSILILYFAVFATAGLAILQGVAK